MSKIDWVTLFEKAEAAIERGSLSHFDETFLKDLLGRGQMKLLARLNGKTGLTVLTYNQRLWIERLTEKAMSQEPIEKHYDEDGNLLVNPEYKPWKPDESILGGMWARLQDMAMTDDKEQRQQATELAVALLQGDDLVQWVEWQRKQNGCESVAELGEMYERNFTRALRKGMVNKALAERMLRVIPGRWEVKGAYDISPSVTDDALSERWFSKVRVKLVSQNNEVISWLTTQSVMRGFVYQLRNVSSYRLPKTDRFVSNNRSFVCSTYVKMRPHLLEMPKP